MEREELQAYLGQETKYSRWYLNIIFKAKSEKRKKLKKKDNPQYIYYENHHILPRSIFPQYINLKSNSWNGVLLTAREHFICHALVWKHYKSIKYTYGESKMGLAFNMLSKRRIYFSRLYSICKFNCLDEEFIKQRTKSLKITLSKRTPEEWAIVKQNISRETRNGINKVDIEKRKLSKQKERLTKQNMSDEEKAIISKKISDKLLNRPIEEKKKTAKKMSNSRSGYKNYQTTTVAIFDHHQRLILISNNGVQYMRKKLNIPTDALRISYNKGQYMYENKANRSFAIKNGRGHMVGWYMIKLKTLTFYPSNYTFSLLHFNNSGLARSCYPNIKKSEN